jgi:hypothetical protein
VAAADPEDIRRVLSCGGRAPGRNETTILSRSRVYLLSAGSAAREKRKSLAEVLLAEVHGVMV